MSDDSIKPDRLPDNLDPGQAISDPLAAYNRILQRLAYYRFGEVNPITDGFEAPTGAVYTQRGTDALFQKFDVGNKDWKVFAGGSSGADGSLILVGAGVPAPGLGSNLDIYIDQNNGDLYQKDGTGTWNLVLNLQNKITNVIVVDKTPTLDDFSTPKAAVDSITDASDSNRYVVFVGPGLYVHSDTMFMKPFVDVICIGQSGGAIIEVSDSSKDVVRGTSNCAIRGFSFRGATDAGTATVRVKATPTTPFQVIDCFFDIQNQMVVVDPAAFTLAVCIVRDCVSGSGFTRGYVVEGAGFGALNLLETRIQTTSGANGQAFFAAGPTNQILGQSLAVVNIVGLATCETGIEIQDGALVTVSDMVIQGCDEGIHIPNVGAAPTIQASNLTISQSINNDAFVEHPTAVGFIGGTFSKIDLDPAITSLTVVAADNAPDDNAMKVVGSIFHGDRVDELSNLTQLVKDPVIIGQNSGGDVTPATGLTIDVAAGEGYLIDPVGQYIKQVTWNASSGLAVDASANNFIFVDTNGVVTKSASPPNETETILLARVVTKAAGVCFVDDQRNALLRWSNSVEEYLRLVNGPRFVSGSTVSESGTRNLDVTSGKYYFGSSLFTPTGGTAISWDAFYSDGGSGHTVVAGQTTVDNAFYDDGSGTLAAIPAGEFTNHTIFLVGDGAIEEYMVVYGQATFPSLSAAQGAQVPTPPSTFLIGGVTIIATVIVQQGVSAISSIEDERPFGSGILASGGPSANHGSLSGLLNDDHVQYLLANGTRTMSGALNMGSNAITNAGTINGVSITAHAARHLPNGADPITTAAAVEITDSTNGVGVANSLARSDHSHAHGDRGGGTLHAVATVSVAGFMSAADKVALNNVATLTAAAPVNVTKAAAAVGVATEAARADHKHDIDTATAGEITDSTNSEGSATSLARSDHGHAHGNRGGGTLHAAATISVNGFMSSTDKTKLNGIEAGATADQTAGEIKTAYESNANTNAFTDADETKLDGIESGATADQSDAEIKTAYENNANTNAFTDADETKLDGIEAGAEVNDLFGGAPPVIDDTTSAAGVATTKSRSDHTHGHGNRGGGTLHALATVSVNGFMSSTDKTKLDGIASGAQVNDAFGSAPPQITDSVSNAGAAGTKSRSDHTHGHGNRGGGTLHAAATISVSGFMSATDKTKLDSLQNGGGITSYLHASKNATHAVTTVFSTVPFEVQEQLVGSAVDRPSNTQFRALIAGDFKFTYGISIEHDGNNNIECRARINAATTNEASRVDAHGHNGATSAPSKATIITLAINDIVTLEAASNSSSGTVRAHGSASLELVKAL